MIKNYNQFISEDIRNKEISLLDDYHIKQLYPDINLTINNAKIVISYISEIELNVEFYEALKKDHINKDNIIFVDCEVIALNIIDGFTKISDYGTFGENIVNFGCSQCKNITSLEGSPKIVNTFSCSYCMNLTSLQGSPEVVHKCFYCSYCKNLTNLNGAPETIDGDFICRKCNPDFINLAKQKYGLMVVS